MPEKIIKYKGVPLTDLTKEQLIDNVKELCEINKAQRERADRELGFIRSIRRRIRSA